MVDPRVLPLHRTNGERWRPYEDVLRVSYPEKSLSDDWGRHIRGSPSLLEALQGYRRVGGPLGHHREWVRSSNCSANKPHAHEHYILCAILELAICFDQFNGPSSLALELLGRRLQLIESAYEMSGDGKAPDFFHSQDMMGFSERASGAVVSATLGAESAARLKSRAEIEKELRKAKGGSKAGARLPEEGGAGH